LPEDRPYDVTLIGAGLIGLASARCLLESHPDLHLLVLEKDPRTASQQSGHYSGVIHSGIYYRPGSLKARFSVEGRRAMLGFCEENGVPTGRWGKLIVAICEPQPARIPAGRSSTTSGSRPPSGRSTS